jgi:tripartite ATP-independent transporter DctP family solute receptor
MKPQKAFAVVLVTLVTAFLLIFGAFGSEAAAAPIVIKIGHTDSSARSTHIWSLWLGEYLEEKAPGQFIVEVYPDGQLGDTPDLIAGVKLGTITMAFDLSAAVAAAAGPEASCIDLPYLYPTYEDWITGTFEKGGLALFNDCLKDYGYYCVDMYYNGMRQVISRKGNYHNANDLKGQKVRIAQNVLNVALWKAMGANPTPMAWGEVITSLSQGQIDALDHSLGVFNDFNLHEIARYITLTNHASSPFPIITSLEWWESLPKDLRAILEEGIHEMARQQRDEERGKEQGYLDRFTAEGATVEALTPDEVKAFIETVQPVYADWRKQVGDKMMDAWLATVP